MLMMMTLRGGDERMFDFNNNGLAPFACGFACVGIFENGGWCHCDV